MTKKIEIEEEQLLNIIESYFEDGLIYGLELAEIENQDEQDDKFYKAVALTRKAFKSYIKMYLESNIGKDE